VIVERNTWWDGKVMRARDFAADTEYLLDHHRLHNRLLHGWGIVCGLQVERHPRPECAQAWVLVTSGLALDCHGRELVLTCDVPFELPDRDEPYLLCARFKEEKVEPVPALYAEGICDPHHHEFNRYRDGVSLVAADVTPHCWPTEHGDRSREKPKGKECKEAAGQGPEHRHDHGCDDQPCHEHCLDADCPCGDLVPLARVMPLKVGGFELDLEGRRVQPPSTALLTHITHVSWPHGGVLTLRHLREDQGGELRIRFDHPLREAHGAGSGVNPHTFAVQYSAGPAKGMEFLLYPEDSPPRVEDGCVAVFTVDPAYLAEDGRRTLRNGVVYVSLRCDFIQDRRGVPVDGSHLGGRLPSGNGVQGGLFESWFEVRDDNEDRRAEA
jgi:hypothetical protein